MFTTNPLKTKILIFTNGALKCIGNYTFRSDESLTVAQLQAEIGHKQFAIEAPQTFNSAGYVIPIGITLPDEEGRNIIVPQAEIEAVELIGGVLWYKAKGNLYTALLLHKTHIALVP